MATVTLVYWAGLTANGVLLDDSDLTGGDIPEIVVRRIAYADGTFSTAQAATDMAYDSTVGLWYYRLTGCDETAYDYVAWIHTDYDADAQELWTRALLDVARYDTEIGRLDATITSRATTGTAMTLANNAITSAKYDESTAFPVKSTDSGSTQIARVGADGDTLETLSDEIAAQNDLSAAEVNAEADQALADYDAPTKAEMDTAHALLATAASIAALNDVSAADIWGYASRTLTQTLAAITAALSGDDVTITRGDEMTLAFTGLGSVSGYKNIWFTVKKSVSYTDAQSVLMVDADTGLLYVQGAAPTAAANGSISVDDADAGDITIVVAAVETAKLTIESGIHYDVQWMDADDDIHTLTIGLEKATVSADVTRSTSDT